MARVKTKVRTFRRAAKAAAKSHCGGQGFHSIGFPEEQRLVSEAWVTKKARGGQEYHRLLTDHAKSIIRRDTEDGRFNDRADNREPPFMAPSEDPGQYSLWCSSCNDFGENMVLCAGCRVALCVATADSPTGCLAWSASLEDPDFIYYCPFCEKGASALVLQAPKKLTKRQIYFRYDPPVLIISATWHETSIPYGQMLHDNMLRKYVGNEDTIILMEVALDVAAEQAANDGNIGNDDKTIRTNSSKAAESFLEEFPYAKIVVIIDTHCLENGFFVWRGNSRKTYEACPLLAILKDCIPKGIFKYLSDAENTPDHSHKTLITNLSCGPSINQPESRHSLLKGHGADILSFANLVTMVGDIAPVVNLFVMLWVQSPSNYDYLVARTMPTNWVDNHQPVISGQTIGHTLYSKFAFCRPGGQLVPCHRRCGQTIRDRRDGDVVHLVCVGCRSTCKIPVITTDRDTTLGSVALVKTEYPPGDYPIEWRLPVDPVGASANHLTARNKSRSLKPKASGYLPPEMTRSTSLPAPTLTSSPSSSSLRIILPARPPAITRSQSTLSLHGNQSASPTPPPLSPHEPSPTPSDRKRSLAQETRPSTQKKQKNK